MVDFTNVSPNAQLVAYVNVLKDCFPNMILDELRVESWSVITSGPSKTLEVRTYEIIHPTNQCSDQPLTLRLEDTGSEVENGRSQDQE